MAGIITAMSGSINSSSALNEMTSHNGLDTYEYAWTEAY
jgi:hypothetical protein